jgi:polar amino acid transport system substrate-binding protein
MKQLTQQLKNGRMEIIEVPAPSVERGKVLVKNYFSVISAGTEGKTVSDARLGYIAKAKSRKKELMAVIEMAKTQGLWNTYKIVMNKLEAPSTLGYSAAGEVIAVGDDITDIKVGDFVACAGLEACHAEVISVPYNLCVKVNKSENIKAASFVALGAIALQGVRRAECKVGENVLVIGLGTLGLLTIQFLNASGCNAFGMDIDEWAASKALENGAFAAYPRSKAGIEGLFMEQTQGIGFDSIIITAGTSSLDPINFAGRLCRRKGKVVIVGAVPTGFNREDYYKKELDLLMSTSYGPGRYDKNYEEKGMDYPIGYVRWTEKRNMQAFIELIESGKVDLSKIITHTFNLNDAPKAYDIILNHTEKYSGMVLAYNNDINLEKTVSINSAVTSGKGNVGFIGAGSFAQNMLLPNVSKISNMVGVATSHGNTSFYVAKKFGFNKATTDYNEILNNKDIDTVFIATRHNSHCEYVKKSLEAGKHVFVEKPLCLNANELDEIKSIYQNHTNQNLLVGFNRRFSPFAQKINKMLVPAQKKAINIRVNAGSIPPDHWIQDPEIGGGRIIGEACHFVDLAMFLAQSKIKTVYANAMNDAQNLLDTVNINLSFENGSVANISYFANGSKRVPKERIELFADGMTITIDDFSKMQIADKSVKKMKLSGQDKGHKNEVEAFINSVKKGEPSPISFEDIYMVTKASFAVIESIKSGKVIDLKI